MHAHILEYSISIYRIYSRKVLLVESLVNLVNCLQFTKLKLLVTINKPLADLFIHQTFFCQMFEKSKFAKLSCYTVSLEI